MTFPTTPTFTTGELVEASDWNAIPTDLTLLKTSIADDGRIAGEIQKHREAITSVSFSGTPTFDLALSNNFKLGALTANVTTITVSNWVASKATTVVIRFTQDGTGGRTVAFPAGWKWSGGTVPVMPSGANKNLIITLYSDDGGTTIFAAVYVGNI